MYEKSTGKKMHIRRADVFLAIALIVLSLGLFIVYTRGQKVGDRLVISWDGAEVESISLASGDRAEAASGPGGTRYCLLLYTEGGIFCRWYDEGDSLPETPAGKSYNLLSVSEGTARMEAADCRDQICVHHRPISGGGESIICLPHKLVVEIRGAAEEDSPDGMVK